MYFITILNTVIIPVAFALTFLSFFVAVPLAVVLGIQAGKITDSQKRTSKIILAVCVGVAPLVIFFLLVSIWGIVNILVGTFGQ